MALRVVLVIIGAAILAECVRVPSVRPLPVVNKERPVIDGNLIHSINKQNNKWKAGENEYFQGWSVNEAKHLMGFIPNPESAKTRPVKKYNHNVKLPANFDAATQWPACTTIATIYDQARCGSCWAFGCVEAVSDRFCIHGNNQPLPLSFMDEVCCGPDYGCEGGDAGDAWDYVQQTGLVPSACSPYTIPTCNVTQEPCLNFLPTPPCVQQCSDSEVWANSLHLLSTTYGVNADQNDIMQEMYTNGPVEACFSVYQDFLQYKTGVYQYDGSSEYLGGHCVKCRGWGVENGTPYWICNNSWTTYWGDNGIFKILRGSDECGIEDDVVAGMPSTSH